MISLVLASIALILAIVSIYFAVISVRASRRTKQGQDKLAEDAAIHAQKELTKMKRI
jgi:Tfp pilus assembly protein PilW